MLIEDIEEERSPDKFSTSGGVTMIVVRIFAVLIFSSLLSGCYILGDYNSLKRDIKLFKDYLRALPPPSECKVPGEPQARVCYYKLKVEPFEGGEPGLYKGHVPKSVVEFGNKECQEVKKRYENDQDGKSFFCPNPEQYSYTWYGFRMRDTTKVLNKNVEYDFISEPGSNYLRLGTPAEVIVQNP